MGKLKIALVIILITIPSIYLIKFGDQGLSPDQGVWGTFGDYLGGTINPILTFLSILLLIKSIDLQQNANSSIIEESNRQKLNETKRSFEVQLYNIIEHQHRAFSEFKIINPTTKEEFHSYNAATLIEDTIIEIIKKSRNKEKAIEALEILDPDDRIYAIVRRFSIALTLIEEYASNHLNEENRKHEKEHYQERLLNLTELKILSLITISCNLLKKHEKPPAHVSIILKSGIFDRDGFQQYATLFD